MRTSYPKRKNKALIITLIAVFALLLGVSALAYTQKWWPFNGSENHIVDGINYGPPTEEEIENSQNAKKDIIKEDEAKESESGGANLKKVSVGVSHADMFEGNVEVRAFVSGVVEGTGTCTATLTLSGAQTVTKSSEAFIDASTSQCKPILIPLSAFSKDGEWTLVVNYKSPTSTGESEKIPVNITR